MRIVKDRNGRTTIAAVLMAAMVLAAALAGCAPGEKDPARKVLAEAVKAMGGRSLATGWKTRVEKGTMISVWPGWGTLQAECAQYAMKPDKLLLDQDFSANDNPFYFVYTLNGDQAWQEVNLGIRQNQRTTDMLLKRMKEIDGIPWFLDNSDSIYIETDVPDDSLMTGSEITRVACITGTDTVMFDISNETSLPLRKIEHTPSGRSHLLMEDYRKTGKRTLPFHLRQFQDGTLTNEYLWESIEFDVEIDPAIFEKNRPAAGE